MSYKKQIEVNRAQKDHFFKSSHQSPISHHDQHNFSSLDYFPIDEKYVFKLKLNGYEKPEIIQMETSDGLVRDYYRIGFLKFHVEDEEASVHVYQQVDNPEYFFVPFRDATSGPETYGAGRYMDVEREDDLFVLDFNKAYSPFCAYNENYSCPLPPFENHLKVPIRAGEKDFVLQKH